MSSLKSFFVLAFVGLALLLNFVNSPKVAAVDCNAPNLSTKQAIECGACQGSGQPCAEQTPDKAAKSLQDTVEQIINILSIIVGVVAVFAIILGGLRYITSAGDSARITGAKNTILYALIGLIIVALAQLIVRFVLTTATPESGSGSSSTSTSSGAPAPKPPLPTE